MRIIVGAALAIGAMAGAAVPWTNSTEPPKSSDTARAHFSNAFVLAVNTIALPVQEFENYALVFSGKSGNSRGVFHTTATVAGR
jgi:hypothetical protein